MIHVSSKNVFESLIKSEFSYSNLLKTRDFQHLYEFQKYFLHRSIRRLMGYVKEKQYQYWHEKIDITPWHDLSI